MGYPYGQPGNSGYGPYPQPGYAQPGYPQPGYPQPVGPVRKPGGGTAITAGVLATIQGALGLVVTVVGTIGTRADRHEGYDNSSGDVVALIVVATYTGLYLTAAILFFFRRRAGRYMIIGTSGLTLVGGIGGMIYSLVVNPLTQGDVIGLLISILIVFVIEFSTLCLAAVSPTRRWIEARTAAPTPLGQYRQPAPMYGPQQYPPY
ncbi:hypothetical protein [Nocardia vaccinii]|uniref:hypothetical protein n=1 Tax=Nocardia vaccinii TaxID=1822 RepID=UPI000A01AC9D|nr:hypothetical protein [Nocardia vaccinii]